MKLSFFDRDKQSLKSLVSLKYHNNPNRFELRDFHELEALTVKGESRRMLLG